MARTPDGPSEAKPLVVGPLDGRYRLEGLIGRGGMGAVYRSLDLRLNRPVAVKLLRDVEGADPARFEAEVQTLACFVHPNLVRLLDAGALDGRPYLVMDLVEGPTLARRMSEGKLSAAETAKIGAGVAAALAYVHDAGIVHRDVKPANVLLDSTGTAHLADFGIARLVDTTGLTATGLTLGTPAYLAPEQVQAAEVGPAADIYALGLVLIECLNGKRAFEGTPSEITAARLQRNPPLPDELNADWRALLSSMTARLPGERPPAARVSALLADTSRFDRIVDESEDTRSFGDTTAVLPGRSAGTARLQLTETTLGPTAIASDRAEFRRSWFFGWPLAKQRRLGLVLGLAIVALLVGLAAGGVFGGSGPPRLADSPPKATTTSASTTTSTTSTTTTTIPTTTTTTPVLSVASAAGALVTALETGVNNGSVAPQAGQQLTNQLQPLLFSPHPEQAQQQSQQFDQLVQQFNQDIQQGQIMGRSRIRVLTRAIDNLAASLGTSVSPTTPAPEPAPGPGNGHGHGKEK